MWTVPNSPLTIIAWGTLAALVVLRALSPHPPVTKRALRHIPELRFDDGDESAERYRKDSRSLLYKGYEKFYTNTERFKYLRHGVAFQMRNPIAELGPQLFLPMKYLDEVKNARVSLFSFPAFSEKMFLLNYSSAPQQTDASAHVVRTDLTRNLGILAEAMHGEVIAALDETLSDKQGPITVNAYRFITGIVARVTALALVGPELCRNQEWLELSIGTTHAIMGASNVIRHAYSPRWRWLARWRDEAPRQMIAMRKRAIKLLSPLYKDRAEADKSGGDLSTTYPDCLAYLLRMRDADTSLDGIANQQLFLTIASMHTTSATATSILFDLLAHPEYEPDILADIEMGLAEKGDGPWTLQNVAAMRKLDSFMKESQRIHPLGFITAQRLSLKPHTFKDGLHLPRNTIFQFPADAVHHDPSVYPSPYNFDPWRFYKLRETVDPNRFHFATASDTSLNFGAGSHACPGRFFSGLVIKFVLVGLLRDWDVRFEEGSGRERPRDVCHDLQMVPNAEARVMIERKKGV